MGRRPQAASTERTTPQWCCLQSHMCPLPPEGPRTGWTAAPLEGTGAKAPSKSIHYQAVVTLQFWCFGSIFCTRGEDLKKPVHVTFQKWHFLTRNWESELLPVTPDISCPHSRKASDAGERGAWQHKGSLPPYLQQSTEDGNKPQDKKQTTKNSYMYIICNTGHHYPNSKPESYKTSQEVRSYMTTW